MQQQSKPVVREMILPKNDDASVFDQNFLKHN